MDLNQNNKSKMIKNLSFDSNSRERGPIYQRKSQLSKLAQSSTIRREPSTFSNLYSLQNTLKPRDYSLGKSSLNEKEKHFRLTKITQKLTEIKSSLSFIQINQKNQKAIQIIEAEIQKTTHPNKICENIPQVISTENKNDVSDNILRQFMDVLQDNYQKTINKPKTSNILDQSHIFQTQPDKLNNTFHKTHTNHNHFNNTHNSNHNDNNNTVEKDVDTIHQRVSQAITNSIRIIDQFKHLRI